VVYLVLPMSDETESVREEELSPVALKAFPWAAIVWFGVLLVACYAPVLWRLARQWATDGDMGHGFFVPVVAGYIAWQLRDKLLAAEAAPSWWGLAVLGWGALQLYFATLGAELFLARTAFVISVAGMILLLCGSRILRILAFPLFLLLFMVPIPAILYNQVTFQFQLIASRLAEAALALFGVPVLREGNILELASQRLSVVEACSGIRSLLTLAFLSLVYAYFFDKKVWMRFALLAATVPIAILANASRVTISGLLSESNPKLAEGMFHAASGWLIFMVALLFLVLVHAAINRIYRLFHAK
jgi:exosortase